MILLSIIVVNYNTSGLLERCLRSIDAYNAKDNIEIIVVDNASTDESLTMLDKNFSYVTVIENKANMGFGCANNQAMKIAKGDFYFLLNSDAELCQGTLETLCQFMISHPKAALVGPKIVYPDGRIQYTAGQSINLLTFIIRSFGFFVPNFLGSLYRKARIFRRLSFSSPSTMESISAAALLVRKEFFLQEGGFDENYFMYVEDVDWALRARKAGWEIWYVPSVLVIHLNGGSSNGKYREYNPQALKSLIYFFQKHKGLLGNISLRVTGLIINILKLAIGLIICLATLGTKGRKLLKQAWGSTLVFVLPLNVKTKVVNESA